MTKPTDTPPEKPGNASGKRGSQAPRRPARKPRKDPTAGGKRAAMGPEREFDDDQGPSYGFPDSGRPDATTAQPGLAEAGPQNYSPETHSHEGAAEDAGKASLSGGAEAISGAAKTLPNAPGVYRMLDAQGEVLYVGKARSLRKRVATYAQIGKLPRRLQRMVANTRRVEVVRTHTEVEALLLESNLIKRHMPRYNVLLRDDKSFPYILLTADHDYPEIAKHRGAQDRPGDYFGPFASAGAVNRTITALEKAFLLRSCSDSVFANRDRPCLMFHIKRCSAPCVGRISKPAYDELVQEARDFLTGRNRDIQSQLAEAMERAAEALDFETAAAYRDRIRALTQIQAHQDINVSGVQDADVIALTEQAGQSCIQVFFFRAGRNYGNRAYFPSHDKAEESAEVLAAFIAQFYDNKPTPPLVLVSETPADAGLLAEALSLRAERKVEVACPQRGEKRKLVENALSNAREALARRLSESSAQRRLLEGLAERLELDATPERIEVYDNSHIQGRNPYGAMIVAGPEGFRKNAYRKFAIRGLKEDGSVREKARPDSPVPDDYAMMREVMLRRFSRAQKEDPERTGGQWPDLVLLDGGRGQLNAALEVFADLGIDDQPIVAVAKGPDRDAGRERIFRPEREPMLLPPRDPVLYFIQRLRDEAHRFAIGSHRTGRGKQMSRSQLDEVPGIGAKRKKALLLHFGSARAVSRAGLADLEAVEGISETVARRIYDHFHGAE